MLERARRSEVDYLAVCPPSGLPVAIGGIDYTENPGAGTLTQLAVHGTTAMRRSPGAARSGPTADSGTAPRGPQIRQDAEHSG